MSCPDEDCGCNEKSLSINEICNPIDCDSNECSESFPAECILYTGEDIVCNDIVIMSEGDSIAQGLANAVAYFCDGATYTGPDLICEGVVIMTAGDTLTQGLTNAVNYFCNTSTPSKDVFYQEFISTLDISENPPAPGPGQYHFPIGYQILTYTNTSGSPMTVEVHGSYNTFMVNQSVIAPKAENWIDGAIIKTNVSGTNIVEYEDLGIVDIEGYLFDSNGDIVTQDSDESVVTTPSGLSVNFNFLTQSLDQNKSIFKVLTLGENESVSLMFKTKGGTSAGGLKRAQILVKEL